MRRIRQSVLGLVGAALTVGLTVFPVQAATGLAGEVRRAQPATEWRCVEVNGEMDLNIRAGPGVSYTVTSTRPAGEQLEAAYDRVESADGYNWVPVRYLGGEGWSITARLSPCESEYGDTGDNVVLESINQDGVLDHQEIEAVARSVVLIGNVQNQRIVATGTGTITTPDGLIVTNAHVVEEADFVGIGLLNDINDPPEFQYIGEVVKLDLDIDVALIAIRLDVDGNPVDAATLSLPYIPTTVKANEVFRGDPVYIFGYPGIGDDYLVVTTGSIVSVENGEVNNQRLPVWYRTDAEIAPGNSGGLAVSSSGEFIGIPTFVRSEEETGGRLGGIRPAQVAMMALLDEAMVVAEGPPTAQPATPPAVAAGPAIDFQSLRIDHGIEVGGQTGMGIHIAFGIVGWENQNASVVSRFYHDDTVSKPLINPNAPLAYRDSTNQVIVTALITPCCDDTLFDDLSIFIPYAALGLNQPGTYPLKLRVDVIAEDSSWHTLLSWEYITVTQP